MLLKIIKYFSHNSCKDIEISNVERFGDQSGIETVTWTRRVIPTSFQNRKVSIIFVQPSKHHHSGDYLDRGNATLTLYG